MRMGCAKHVKKVLPRANYPAILGRLSGCFPEAN